MPASNTVTFELIAGPFNFNGYASGGATLTLPPEGQRRDQLRRQGWNPAQRE